MPNCITTLSTTTGNLIVGVSAHKQCLSLARSQSDLNESNLAYKFQRRTSIEEKKKNDILFLIFDYRHQDSQPNAI